MRESLLVSQRAALKLGLAPAFALLACLAAMESKPARALRLAGAAASAVRAVGATEDLYAWCRARAEAPLELARRAVAEQAAAAAWSEGEAMSLEQAIAYALADEEPDSASRPTVGLEAPGLTAREREVAALAAQG